MTVEGTGSPHRAAGDADTAQPASERLSFDEIEVSFGPVTVLREISVSFRPGEIVGLLGHNGAGKSTLINAATGALRSYRGVVSVDGESVPAGSTPKQVAERGIAVIHQEPALAPNLSVFDNLYLARADPAPRREQEQRARKVLDDLGAGSVRLDQPVLTLSLGERQLVDLARSTLLGDIKVLFLDEPTAALGEAETRTLHALIRRFAQQATTVVYVSHRLPDIIDVCTRIVALRDGELALDAPVGTFTNQTLASALAGDRSLLVEDRPLPPAEAERALTVSHDRELSFRRGEIVGLFGMAAGPQFRLLNRLFTESTAAVGAVVGDGATTTAGPRSAIRGGIHLVPGDRERDGLIGGMSAMDNVFLPWMRDRALASPRARARLYGDIRERLAIAGPDGNAPISTFSGGNRQKHLLARWIFPRRPALLLLEQPTQGVDVGAKADIRACLWDVAAEGTTVIVASAETDEIASLCDRAYVIGTARSAAIDRSPRFEADLLSSLFDITSR